MGMERGPLMPSQKPIQRPSLTCTTATRLTAMATAMAMATERGLLKLSQGRPLLPVLWLRIPSLRLCLRKVTCQSRTCPYEILVYHSDLCSLNIFYILKIQKSKLELESNLP